VTKKERQKLMQVNNNVQSPNFGMALKISKGAKQALKELPMETIENLQKAGEKLKDTKFYHVKVNDDLTAQITADKDAYFGLFKNKPYSSHYGVERIDGRDFTSNRVILINNNNYTIAGVSRYVPFRQTEPSFHAWGPLGSYTDVKDIRSLAEVAKILDGAAAEKAYQTTAKNAELTAEQAKVSKAVDSLLDTFGE